MANLIDVIIPSTGNRVPHITRAIASVHKQTGVAATPFVVVNGGTFQSSLVSELERRPDVRVQRIDRPSVSNARREGRLQVKAPFFAFLDDDDELLPTAMETRLAGFCDPSIDVVATNGYAALPHGRELRCKSFNQDPGDPALALLKENWLLSSGALYRTATVSADDLADLPDFVEMTKLAFRLALTHNIMRLDIPTSIKHYDAPERASLSRRYLEEQPRVLHSMEKMTSRADLRTLIRGKRSMALYALATAALEEGQILTAARHYLGSRLLRSLGAF